MAGPFNDPAQDAGFDMSDAYRRASSIKPVKAKDLKRVYRPYNRTGTPLKVGGKKRKSDKQLYKLAAQEVVEWWKHKQKTKGRRKKQRAANPGRRAASTARTSSGRTSGSAGTRGAMLPDTAMPAPGTRVTRSTTKLPDIRVRARRDRIPSRYIGKMGRLLERF